MRRGWGIPLFASLSGYGARDFNHDLVAGLTLAAIAVPEQMATARLGGFPPEFGLFVFVAGSVAFAVFGSNRFLSAGADSTITPIFAAGLATAGAAGTAGYAGAAAALALMVGAILIVGGLGRVGWIADLLSVPVVTGFLAGIAVHIAASQLPGLLGIPDAGGSPVHRAAAIATTLDRINAYSLAIGLAVMVLIVGSERISARIPSAFAGVLLATVAVVLFGLEGKGVAVLGAVQGSLPRLRLPDMQLDGWVHLVPLALVIAAVVMVQTAATTRSFVAGQDEPPDVNRDFIGVGTSNLLAGLAGLFPVNASPPRTAIVTETGGRSQVTGLLAATAIAAGIGFGAGLLRHVPQAALSGVLLFIAGRIVRVRDIVAVYRRTRAEFALVILTAAAIVVLPIETGVAVGIVLSLMHGMWTITRARPIEFEKVPGTSIWWAPSATLKGETVPGIAVIAFQAPLSFLNAYEFRRGVLDVIERRATPPTLVVLEASSIVEIDYTASTILIEIIRHCQGRGIALAVARLESVRAQEAFARFGILDILGPDHLFHSVDEAVRTLAGRR